MPNLPFYKSQFWFRLRAQALKRDAHKCVTPGCPEAAVIVNHKIPRGHSNDPGPLDVLQNLESLCRACDNRHHGDKARNKTGVAAIGCDADGMPHDPNHPWRKQ